MCSRANPHDVHGLPRFRTNDVLLGTSGAGVRFSVVSIQLFRPVNIFFIFRLYRFRIHLLISASSSQQPEIEQRPLEYREAARSTLAWMGIRNLIVRPSYFYLHPSRLDFASGVSLRIRNRVLTLSAWSSQTQETAPTYHLSLYYRSLSSLLLRNAGSESDLVYKLRSRHRGRPRSTRPHRPPTCSPPSRAR